MTKEEIYDNQINPLMAKVIEICKQHKIAAFASFRLESPEDDDLHCTTALLTPDFNPSDAQLRARDALLQPGLVAFAITTSKAQS